MLIFTVQYVTLSVYCDIELSLVLICYDCTYDYIFIAKQLDFICIYVKFCMITDKFLFHNYEQCRVPHYKNSAQSLSFHQKITL